MPGCGIVAGMWEVPQRAALAAMISPFNPLGSHPFYSWENREAREVKQSFSVSQSWQGTAS